jgi:hypothetical protein
MTYAELSEAQVRRSRQFAEAQTDAMSVYCDAERDLKELQAENAKLRELVRDMYKAFMHGNCYRWCEFKEPCNYISDGNCQWYDRMRELGVDE